MDWHCLGHATWLAEVDGLRLVFDPLLESAHFGGVFEVTPSRSLHVHELRADFIFISHRHPDHFDLGSLRRLAAIDEETVVVTPDDLVASCATRLGFRTVRRVAPETTLELDGPEVVLTPSAGATEPEWGAIVSNADGVVFNQVDTSLGRPDDVRGFLRRLPTRRITLALARYCPLLEVEALTAGPIGFPFERYRDELERAVALDARVIVPSSAGARHAGPYAFMNRLANPVTEARFLRDGQRRAPTLRFERLRVGGTYRVQREDVEVIPNGAASFVTLHSKTEDAPFYPLEVPALVDPAEPSAEPHAWALIEPWLCDHLAPALGHAHIRHAREDSALETDALVWLLSIVLPSRTVWFMFRTTATHVHVARFDHEPRAEWDVLCSVAGTLLADVIAGRRSWGEVLLSGMLRGCHRVMVCDEQRPLEPAPVQALFVYEAISYETSTRRALEHLLRDSS